MSLRVRPATLVETQLVTLLTRLGIEPPIGPVFWSPTLLPVIPIDLGGNAKADLAPNPVAQTGPVNVLATAGETTAPAANTRLADTGGLPISNVSGGTYYDIDVLINADETNTFRFRRRNASDTADVWSQLISVQAGNPFILRRWRANIGVVNQRFVIENVTAGAAGKVYQATLFCFGPLPLDR